MPFRLPDGDLAWLASAIGLPYRTLQRVVEELEAAGLLRVQRRGGAANRYAVAAPPETCAKMAQASRTATDATAAQDRRHNGTPTKATMARERRHDGAATSLHTTWTTGGQEKAQPPSAAENSEATDSIAALAHKAWEVSPKPKDQTERDCEETIRRHLADKAYGISALRDYLSAGETPGPFWALDKVIPASLERREKEARLKLAVLLSTVDVGWTATRKDGRLRGVVHERTNYKIVVHVSEPQVEWPEVATAEGFAEWNFEPLGNPEECT